MTQDPYSQLVSLSERHGAQEFGRICQSILELTLRRAGFHTRGRSVERPDISAERSGEKYAIEAKAPVGGKVLVTKRDLDGLKEFESAGVIPVLAVLLVEPSPRWVMVDARSLRPGGYSKIALSVHDIAALSREVGSLFPEILSEQFELALGRGSEGLHSKL